MTTIDTPSRPATPSGWEALWAPYDESTYLAALDLLAPDDVVLDLGAGDLRFARRAARRVRKVVAVERNPAVLPVPSPQDPGNLEVVCADTRAWSFPEDITVGVLLMRHCRHFADYAARLEAVGCRRLITNARWGMDVECVPLGPWPAYRDAPPGWYACACGAVGFKPGSPEELHAGSLNACLSVEGCPACLARTPRPMS
ncbi:MAG TPA: rRNA adenine N-6-methyltransferase family protein [Holophaga sp.]|nr:rRNA adenine N-6-methyltransferase family protein [Holophaga sp.]